MLLPDDFSLQPTPFVSPLKWHLAHTTWFFETFLLKQFAPGYRPFHKDYGYLFNSYYESIGPHLDRLNRGMISRPSLQEILDYREYVDQAMQTLFERSLTDEVAGLLQTGINHEQQHQELFIMDAKYILGHSSMFPPLIPESSIKQFDFLLTKEEKTQGWIEIPEGTSGVGHKGNGFSYDNELPPHKVYIQPLMLRKNLVTNGEYLDFIADGGYEQHHFWLSDGWEHFKKNRKCPLYWHNKDGEWLEYDLNGLNPLNKKLPVKHITYYEADAFCAWKGCSLPTEFVREVAHEKLPSPQSWEWTASAYLPYPGYKKAKGAIGEYNGKFMVNQMVLKGGATITPLGHSRPTYRNFFHPGMNWQYSGIRLAKRE